ncbi:MAG TPA: hypothetical protein VF263_03325 [Longimicrobiaceae bacterium]
MTRLRALLIPLAALTAAGCDNPLFGCGDWRRVEGEGPLAVSVVAGTTPPPGDSTGRLPPVVGFGAELIEDNRGDDPGSFDDVWNAVAGGASFVEGQGVALTFHGIVPGRDRTTARMILVLPTPLRKGARYPVGRTFPVPIGPRNPDVYRSPYWGRRALRRAGEAEIAMFFGHTRFVAPDPFAQEVPEFVAASATGSVEVVEDRGNDLRLRLDLVAADSAGRPLRLGGDLLLRPISEDRQCTS